jgi:hypothetical protein
MFCYNAHATDVIVGIHFLTLLQVKSQLITITLRTGHSQYSKDAIKHVQYNA